jgi:tetratricopeptide (TPR) repeat protein
MLCYAHRGEIDQAHEHRARYELLTVQAGAAWQAQVWTPAAMALAYLNCGDLVGLKRCLDQLDALIEEIPSLSLYRRMLAAGHLVLRGRYEDAVKAFGELAEDVPRRSHIGWSRLYGGYAEALNGLGQHERARDVCLAALGCVEPEDRQFPALYLILEEQLALAEANLGQLGEAARRVDLLIEEYAAFDNPRVRGSLEATRAMVALLAKDGDAFLNHHGNVERMFRSTGNANLIEQSTRLAQRAVRAGLVNPTWTVSDKSGGGLTATEMPQTIMTVLAGLENPEMRAKYALGRLVESSRASWGLLYFARGAEPKLVARTAGAIPSDELEKRVAALIDPDNEEVPVATEVATTVNESNEAPPEKVPDRPFILRTGSDGPIGVVVLRSRFAPQPELLRAIAAGLAPQEMCGDQQSGTPQSG